MSPPRHSAIFCTKSTTLIVARLLPVASRTPFPLQYQYSKNLSPLTFYRCPALFLASPREGCFARWLPWVFDGVHTTVLLGEGNLSVLCLRNSFLDNRFFSPLLHFLRRLVAPNIFFCFLHFPLPMFHTPDMADMSELISTFRGRSLPDFMVCKMVDDIVFRVGSG